MSRVLVIVASLMISSCSLHPTVFLSVVKNLLLEAFVIEEAAKTLTVVDDTSQTNLYKFYLANFPPTEERLKETIRSCFAGVAAAYGQESAPQSELG
jgi:hypothetical protein